MSAAVLAPEQRGFGLPTRVVSVYAEHGEPLAKDVASGHASRIESYLADGDVERAYEEFSEWIRREARYAGAGRSTNLGDLVASMLGMLDWMYERVPRRMARVAAGAR